MYWYVITSEGHLYAEKAEVLGHVYAYHDLKTINLIRFLVEELITKENYPVNHEKDKQFVEPIIEQVCLI